MGSVQIRSNQEDNLKTIGLPNEHLVLEFNTMMGGGNSVLPEPDRLVNAMLIGTTLSRPPNIAAIGCPAISSVVVSDNSK